MCVQKAKHELRKICLYVDVDMHMRISIYDQSSENHRCRPQINTKPMLSKDIKAYA